MNKILKIRCYAGFFVREEWLRYGRGRMYIKGKCTKRKKPNVVGNRLREAREIYGLTQDELAIKTGLGHTTISNIELGIRKGTQKTVDIICRELEINEAWLRGRDILMSSGIGRRVSKLRAHLCVSS